ncbi:MAG TPA: hypothetical protein VGG58_04410 [Candidatus Acidoferrum sp.]
MIDAAASGTESSGDLRAHLSVCAGCRDRVEQQRSLFAAIESTLRQTMNAPLPPALLQRFEARLAQQVSAGPREPRLRWMHAFAAVAAAVSVILFVSYLRLSKPNPQIAQRVPAVQGTNPGLNPLERATSIQHKQEMSAPQTKQHSPELSANAPKQPEVLVPPDDRIAFEHFLADVHDREDLAALSKRVPQQPELRVEPLDMPDIQTVSLTVQPIQESDAVSNR